MTHNIKKLSLILIALTLSIASNLYPMEKNHAKNKKQFIEDVKGLDLNTDNFLINLIKYQTFSASYCHLTSMQLENIFKIVKKDFPYAFRHITTINLKECYLKTLPPIFYKFKHLIYLDLTGNNFSKEEIQKITTSFPYVKKFF